jgi:hypothetical protein
MNSLLFNRRTLKPTPKAEVDPIKVKELTDHLLSHQLGGRLQEAFDAYVIECMEHLKTQAFIATLPVPSPPTPFDASLLPKKDITAFVRRKAPRFQREK